MKKTIEQQVLSYVSSKQGRWADSTISTVYHKLVSVLRRDLKDPAQIYHTLKSEGYGPYTIQSYFVALNRYEKEVNHSPRFQKWMNDNRLLFQHCYKKKESAMNRDEFNTLLAKASNTSTSLFNFIALMGQGGLRKSETFTVRVEDIHQDLLEVRAGKSGKQRFIPFSRDWLNLEGLQESDFIVPSHLVYWKFFKENSDYTPHDLRAYYANYIVNLPGMSIEDARQLLGHENIHTTSKYLRANKDRQKKLLLGESTHE